MKKKSIFLILPLLTSLVGLTACEATKEEMGLTRRMPDEFAVARRAPLEMPPDYYLRPPVPGAERPQEQAPAQVAKSALLGGSSAGKVKAPSKAEAKLLEQSQAGQADSQIRQIINAETQEMAERDKPTIQRLLDLGGKSPAPAQVVDAPAEATRLKQNKEAGAPVTTGQTPTVRK